MVVRRSDKKESFSFLFRNKSQAQPRQTSREKMRIAGEKDKREETRIPEARDSAMKRKGKDISL